MSNDKTLVLRSPFLPKAPWPVDHPIDPPRVDEAAEARKTSAAELVATEVARLGEKRVSSIAALAQAHAQNIRAARDAQAELEQAAAPLPADADLETVAARAKARDDLARYLSVLQERSALSGRAYDEAITAARSDLHTSGESEGGVLRALRSQQRETEAQIAALEQRAGELELLRLSVASGFKAWQPKAPAVEPGAAPMRRKLFG